MAAKSRDSTSTPEVCSIDGHVTAQNIPEVVVVQEAIGGHEFMCTISTNHIIHVMPRLTLRPRDNTTSFTVIEVDPTPGCLVVVPFN